MEKEKNKMVKTGDENPVNRTSTMSHQELMDSAYSKWNDEMKGISQEDFYYALPTIERKAVVLGNFNYQVCNGGFCQWAGNGYMSLHIAELKRILGCMNTETSKKVLKLVESFEYCFDEDEEDEEEMYDGDKEDSAYYKIDTIFEKDCEAYLMKLQENN